VAPNARPLILDDLCHIHGAGGAAEAQTSHEKLFHLWRENKPWSSLNQKSRQMVSVNYLPSH
jgi:hypothetical protein